MRGRVYHGVCHGTNTAAHHAVFVIEEDGTARPIDPRLDLENRSPTGLAWGYSGSGPAQCALALCADALGDADRAIRIYQRFKQRIVAHWPQGHDWTATAEEVRSWVLRIEAEELARDSLRPLPCRHCKGAGWDDALGRECPDCDGSGHRPEPGE